MVNINIENISDLDLNGHGLFQDSESFIMELDDNEESIVFGGCMNNSDCYNTYYCGNTAACGKTVADGDCSITVDNCGNTAICGKTIGY